MNLVEHYITKIYSEKDATEEYWQKTGYRPEEMVFLLDMDVDCYGHKERVKEYFPESRLEKVKKDGYYLA